MSITSALVLLAVLWFLIMFLVLPFGQPSQQERGRIEPGTHAGAPADFRLRRVVWRVTLITLPVWAALCALILSGWIGVEDFDLFSRFGPGSGSETGE